MSAPWVEGGIGSRTHELNTISSGIKRSIGTSVGISARVNRRDRRAGWPRRPIFGDVQERNRTAWRSKDVDWKPIPERTPQSWLGLNPRQQQARGQASPQKKLSQQHGVMTGPDLPESDPQTAQAWGCSFRFSDESKISRGADMAMH